MTLPDFEGVARFSTVVVFDVSLQFCLLAALGAALCVFLRKRDPRLRHLLWLLVLARLAVPFDLQSPAGLSPAIESGLLSGALTRLALFANPEKPVNLGRSAAEVLPARPTSGEGWGTRAPRAKLAQPVDRLSSFSRALATDLGLKKEIPILAIAESELCGPVVSGSWPVRGVKWSSWFEPSGRARAGGLVVSTLRAFLAT